MGKRAKNEKIPYLRPKFRHQRILWKPESVMSTASTINIIIIGCFHQVLRHILVCQRVYLQEERPSFTRSSIVKPNHSRQTSNQARKEPTACRVDSKRCSNTCIIDTSSVSACRPDEAGDDDVIIIAASLNFNQYIIMIQK